VARAAACGLSGIHTGGWHILSCPSPIRRRQSRRGYRACSRGLLKNSVAQPEPVPRFAGACARQADILQWIADLFLIRSLTHNLNLEP
jgi:hypothetical protein